MTSVKDKKGLSPGSWAAIVLTAAVVAGLAVFFLVYGR